MNEMIRSAMQAIMKLAFICLTFPVFVACNDDKEIPDYYVREADCYRFVLNLKALDTSTRQYLIATTYTHTDADGQTVESNFDSDRHMDYFHLSDIYTEFPGEIELTVTQDLKPGIELGNGKYEIGLGITLKAISMKGFDVVTELESAGLGTREINGADASDIFPLITKFRIIADKKGRITLEKSGNN